MAKEKTKINVEYVATSLENHIDCYGNEVIRAGEKFILKELKAKKLEDYKKTGMIRITIPSLWSDGSYATYLVRATLKKVTTKIMTSITEEEVC